jgi:hypothetical protein
MRWMVALQAEGDREVKLEEVVELADAVAAHEGVASGMGTHSYGVQVVVEAVSSDQAVERAMAVFTEAATRAGLPDWPVVNVETQGEEEEMDWYHEIPEVRDRDDDGGMD